ncbi:hypothetical protein CAEBREN_28943 [Caenorhabditis brenneri]|uniref:G-protein coupled receptors family 1 profile domain-containing protein n=1 Tax=Caenorhabditis brenneri TaxID=135651 RepID=G0N9B3_CAEBE|nr:hypothetical protein CAEBREN_28943 [Caenorhabditis brenneri]
MLPLLVFLFLIKNVPGENCNNFTLPNGQVICVSSEGNKLSESKDTPLGEISASIPPGDKDGLYYFVISMFVVSTFTSTILTGTFLVLSIILWPHFKQISSTVFLLCQTVYFEVATAFMIKRVINTVEAEVPPTQKDSIYYLVITLFVLSIVAATLLTGAFLVLLIILWGQFKSTKYYWFLLQLTLSVFLLSTLNLVINVPATLFSLITKEFVTSEVYTILSYAVDYLHYTLLISNLVIAIQRFCVFFYRQLTYRVFDSYEAFILIWFFIYRVSFK